VAVGQIVSGPKAWEADRMMLASRWEGTYK